MDSVLPTKTNLMKIKSSIELSKQGQDLLEKKRVILIQEKEKNEKRAENLRNQLKDVKEKAFLYLKQTNVEIGIEETNYIARGIQLDDNIDIKYMTIMGVDIPSIVYEQPEKEMNYGIAQTPVYLDQAIEEFNNLKKIIIELVGLESTIKRLDFNILKVQKRSNALKEIIIPRDQKIEKTISDALDEREREEFSRLKVVKEKIQ